eukprot:scaffold564412_cov30-Prasinocladus_malaysianus.AAC.1
MQGLWATGFNHGSIAVRLTNGSRPMKISETLEPSNLRSHNAAKAAKTLEGENLELCTHHKIGCPVLLLLILTGP